MWGEGDTHSYEYTVWVPSLTYPSLSFSNPSLGVGVGVDSGGRRVRPTPSISLDVHYVVVSVGRRYTYKKLLEEEVYSIACTYTVIEDCGQEREVTTFRRESEWVTVGDVLIDRGGLSVEYLSYVPVGRF